MARISHLNNIKSPPTLPSFLPISSPHTISQWLVLATLICIGLIVPLVCYCRSKHFLCFNSPKPLSPTISYSARSDQVKIQSQASAPAASAIATIAPGATALPYSVSIDVHQEQDKTSCNPSLYPSF